MTEKDKRMAAKEMEKLKSKLHELIEPIITTSNRLGNLYRMQEFNDEEALKYYELSKHLSEHLPDKGYLAASLSNMGIICFQQTAYPLAIEYFLESLKIRQNDADTDYDGISRLLHYLSICYEANIPPNSIKSNECAVEIEKIGPKRTKYSDDLDTKWKEYENVLQERQKYNDLHGIAGVLCDLGMIFEQKKMPSKAANYYATSFNMNSVPDACRAQMLNRLGEIYFGEGDYIKAIRNFEKSKALSKNLEKNGYPLDQLYLTSLHCTLMASNQKSAIRAWIFQSNQGLGKSYKELKKYNKSRIYFDENLKRDVQDNNTEGIAESLNQIGLTFEAEGNIEMANRIFELSRNAHTFIFTSYEKIKE